MPLKAEMIKGTLWGKANWKRNLIVKQVHFNIRRTILFPENGQDDFLTNIDFKTASESSRINGSPNVVSPCSTHTDLQADLFNVIFTPF